MTYEELQSHLVCGKTYEMQGRTYREASPRIVCVDGLSFSVQANYGAYSDPRSATGPYTAVEIGFPSERIEEIMPYCERPDDPTETVYGYVPVDLVLDVINAHGGVAE